MGRPRGGSRSKYLKNLPPAVPRRGPEAGSIVVIHMIRLFMVRILVTSPASEVKESKDKILTLFFPAFQLLLIFVIGICHGNHRNRKCRYKDEPERICPGKYTGTGNNASDIE